MYHPTKLGYAGSNPVGDAKELIGKQEPKSKHPPAREHGGNRRESSVNKRVGSESSINYAHRNLWKRGRVGLLHLSRKQTSRKAP
jgi:hypothetical protein